MEDNLTSANPLSYTTKGVVIFNGEYPPGVFSSENHKILWPLIFSE